MTEKRFEIICEDYSLVDVPVYVISCDKLKFDIYGSKKDAERLCTLLNENEQLKEEIEKLEVIIKTGNCSLLQKENGYLKDDNEELKSKLGYEQRQHKHWKKECLENIKEIAQLKREIVQLKGDV